MVNRFVIDIGEKSRERIQAKFINTNEDVVCEITCYSEEVLHAWLKEQIEWGIKV